MIIIIFDFINKGGTTYDEIITVSSYAKSMGGTQLYLETGEKISVNDLIKGIIMVSANDAMVAMAERVSGTEEAFVKKMNLKAKELGLKNTHFVNCTGFDEANHYSTASDMVKIAMELVNNYPDVYKFSSVYESYVRENTPNKTWIANTNKLVRFYEGADGLKTGSTNDAGKCIVATAKRNGLRLIAISLGYKDVTTRNKETMDLYKREKLNPFSGCLSSILQIIIILSVFWLVSKPLTYMKKVDTNIINGYVEEIKNEEGKASAYPEIQVIQKKASTDENVNINMEFFGLDLSKVPNQNMGDITVYIIPVLYIITSFISIKITNGKKKKNKTLQIEEKTSKDKVNVEDGKTENDESLEAMQEMNNSMMYMVPIMSISIAFIAPLGLALYWLVSNILIIIERFIIDKIFNKEEEKNA